MCISVHGVKLWISLDEEKMLHYKSIQNTLGHTLLENYMLFATYIVHLMSTAMEICFVIT